MPRQFGWQFGHFGVTAGVAAAATAVVVISATVTPTSNAASRSPAPPAAVHLPVVLTAAIDESPTTLGIADSTLYTLSEADVDKTLDELQALGVKDIRIAVPWIFVQPNNSEAYDWSRLDMVVDAAAERDMGVLGVISGTPAWAGFPVNGHPSPDSYAEFASAVATRYQGKISAYEIWNEPNGVTFWSPVSAQAYTDLLKAAYPAIKAADPHATVIGGVLGAVSTFPGFSTSAASFVEQMYAAGAHGSFDALSFHPYDYVTPFSRGEGAGSPIEQVAAIRALMLANGDSGRKLWATEYGLPTSQVSQTQQAAYLHDFAVAWQQVDGAGPMFVYTTRDTATGAFDDEANFGIFTTDWTKKPAAQTVAALIADLADGTAEPFDVTPYLPANPFLQAVQVFVRQLINQALVIPRLVVQLVRGVIDAVGKAIASGLDSVMANLRPAPAARAVAADARATEAPESDAAAASTASAASDPAPTPRRTATAGRQPPRTPVSARAVHRQNVAHDRAQRANSPASGHRGATGTSARGHVR
ncbi:hypothetical protein B1R94_22905 [Mycolicibacterium litorale]|nr:hypothetical protein B1R94_22905 [Mycolicibacterium litorale]